MGDLDELCKLNVGDRLAEVSATIGIIRAAWNPAVAEAPQSAVTAIPEDNLSDVQQLLFERGFFTATEGFLARRQGHYHTSEGVSVNRRAVRHLYRNIQACQKS